MCCLISHKVSKYIYVCIYMYIYIFVVTCSGVHKKLNYSVDAPILSFIFRLLIYFSHTHSLLCAALST